MMTNASTPSTFLTSNNKRATPLLLALDYGGTKLSAALLRQGERAWLALDRVPTAGPPTAAADQAAMLALARRLLGDVTPDAVGVSFGGPVHAAAGLVLLSHHVPGWENTPLAAQLEAAFGAPAAIANDANAGALGEWRFGAGQGVQSLLYVTVSTGIGGGWVFQGQIFPGADGLAGEIGHTIVNPGGALCACGRRGCLEAEASGPAIARAARHALAAATATEGQALRALVNDDLDRLTGRDVAQAASQGDPLAQAVLDRAATMLGLGLGNVVNLMNPERIILGGGVVKSGDRWWQAVLATARAQATIPGQTVDIRPAALGDDAPLWGAVALAEARLQSPF